MEIAQKATEEEERYRKEIEQLSHSFMHAFSSCIMLSTCLYFVFFNGTMTLGMKKKHLGFIQAYLLTSKTFSLKYRYTGIWPHFKSPVVETSV